MLIFNRIRRWWTQRILKTQRIPLSVWKRVVKQVPLLAALTRQEKHHLRKLTSLLLHDKNIVGAAGLELNDVMRVTIAAQAALLILNLSLDYYDGWTDIIVYPDAFVVPHKTVDAAGVVHESTRSLEGEAWGRGPVILSWADVEEDSQFGKPVSGSNVVLHEFAHKLDFLNGAANGMPPLHADVDHEEWTRDFTHAYDALYERIQQNRLTVINPYAAHSPGEFFAVVTEVFFEDAERLYERFPRVYDALHRYYRQDPRIRNLAVRNFVR